MKLLLLCAFVATAAALPRRGGRQGDAAEVVKVIDEKQPILLSVPTDAENNVVPVIVPKVGNESSVVESSSVAPPQPPSPVPENVPITTEKVPENTPALVPTVVEVSTPDPNNTPPPPANSTTTAAPAEDDDSEEENSDEQEAGDEESAEEDEDDDDDDDEEEDDEEEEEDEEAKERKVGGKKRGRDVAGEEILNSFKEGVVTSGDNDEDETRAVENKQVVKATGLQAVPASVGVGEDDEAESLLLGGEKGQSVIISGNL